MIVYRDDGNKCWEKVEYDRVLDLKQHYYDGVSSKEELDESIYNAIEAIPYQDIEQDILDECKYASKTMYIYIADLSHYHRDLIEAFRKAGYKLNTSKTKGLSYQISTSHGMEQCYYIKIAKNSKIRVYIYDSDNIIRVKEDDLLKDFGKSIDNVTYATAEAIHQLNDLLAESTFTKQNIKLPYTITSYTKRIFNKLSVKFTSNSVQNYESSMGIQDFERYIRNSYHGGFCYYKYDEPGQLGNGYILDVNSLYSSVMKYCNMPVGAPHYFEGKPTTQLLNDKTKCIFIRLRARLHLKKDGIACIQENKYVDDKTPPELFCPKVITNGTYILSSSKIELTLTFYDYILLMQNYNLYSLEYVDYVVYKGERGYFDKYIDMFYRKKQHTYGGKKRIVKLLLNTLYGVMCKDIHYENLKIDDDGNYDYESSDGAFSCIQVGSYIAAAARYKIIQDAKKVRASWVYSDTDSIHIISDRLPTTLKIDENEMGAYKVEYEFTTAIYFKKKTYILIDPNGRFKITKAGCPYKSNKNLEHLMTAIHNGYDKAIEAYRASFEKYEGYDKEKMITFTRNLEYLIKKEDYVSINDLSIPVHKKVLKNPYNVEEIIEWQKFNSSPLDNI